MDVNFINPFLQGTIEVLTKMAFVEPRPGKVYLKDTSLAQGDVSGIIGITGDMIGSLADQLQRVLYLSSHQPHARRASYRGHSGSI